MESLIEKRNKVNPFEENEEETKHHKKASK